MDTSPKHSKASVIWLTGLSGSGKSTIAQSLMQYFERQKRPVELLDGDAIRKVFPQIGFSKEDREEHVKRVAFTASRLEHHGVIVIVALISPYEKSRLFAKKICKNFLEIYISTPLSICQKRDPKGLYRKFDDGLIKNLTGLDDPYEIPTNPSLIVNTEDRTPEECRDEIVHLL